MEAENYSTGKIKGFAGKWKMTRQGEYGELCKINVIVKKVSKSGKEYKNSFFVTAFGDLATMVNNKVNENDLVRVEGNLLSTKYKTKDGKEKESFEITAYKLEILKESTEVQKEAPLKMKEQPSRNDYQAPKEEIPF